MMQADRLGQIRRGGDGDRDLISLLNAARVDYGSGWQARSYSAAPAASQIRR
jgi:hypothetical protein